MRAILVAITAAASLVACASKGSVSSTGGTAAGTSDDDELAAEYQSLIDNAMGQTVCRQEAVTGSRVLTRQVCLTRVQRDAESERTRELLRDMHGTKTVMPPPPPDSSAGTPSP